jgi:threonine dehydrogenase-like Zn-dependent dehydrogenase
MGHEFLGVVEELGADVSGLRKGDLVVAPFVWADNTCDFCREGLQTSCRHRQPVLRPHRRLPRRPGRCLTALAH